MNPNERLKREIKAHLMKTGISQTQLADELGMSRSSLSNILTGEVNLLTSNAVRILETLRVEVKLDGKN